MKVRCGEEGYAMIAALAAMAVLATIAISLVEGNRAGIAIAAADVHQAEAAAAADAGLAMALDGLMAKSRLNRWSADGRTRIAQFGNATLNIRIEEERSKVPLNLLTDDAALRLAEMGGLSGEGARIAAASLLDWLDADELARSDGAETDYYLRQNIKPRNGALQSVDEVARVRGFNPSVVEKLRPFVTVHYGSGSFNSERARPEAIAVMVGSGRDGIASISSAREMAGQRTAIDLGKEQRLIGRPLMIEVEARIGTQARALRRSIVELTGSRLQPYTVKIAG